MGERWLGLIRAADDRGEAAAYRTTVTISSAARIATASSMRPGAAAEGADQGANNACTRSEQQRSDGRPERHPRQSPPRDGRAELNGHRAAGRRRQLIRDEFAGCQACVLLRTTVPVGCC